MDALEVLRTTGAVRAFRPDPVPDALLEQVFEHARFAPSGGNRQPWHVVLVRDPGQRAEIAQLCDLGWREYHAQVVAGAVPFSPGDDGRWHGPAADLDAARATPAPSEFVAALADAPVMAVLVADLRKLAITDIDADHQSIVGGASVYPFAQNVLLAARALGLGGVLTTFLCRAEPQASALLGVPTGHSIAGLLALGYPAQQATRLRRRAVSGFVTIDRVDGVPFGTRTH